MDQTSSSSLWDDYKILDAENQKLIQRVTDMRECIQGLEEELNIAKEKNLLLCSQITEKDNQIGNYVSKLHQISIELNEMKEEKRPKINDDQICLQLRYAEEMNAELLNSVVELTKRVEGLDQKGVKMDQMLDEVERRYQKQTEKLEIVISEKNDLEELLYNSFSAPPAES